MEQNILIDGERPWVTSGGPVAGCDGGSRLEAMDAINKVNNTINLIHM